MKPARDLSLDALLERLTPTPGGWVATYRTTTLRSVFQPVLSITHKRVVGYEALLRVVDSNGAMISPAALFDKTRADADALLLDRLARCLHTANFVAQGIGDGWLFLNVNPRVLDSGLVQREFVEALCRHFALPPNRIVLEVVEQPSRDEAALARTIDMIQHRDFLIAIDDFGTGFSNFDRVWRARPDIVKLDRSLVVRSTGSADDRRIMHHLVSMLHQAGAMVLAEGVESDDSLQALMEADIDFVQGFQFGQPDASIAHASAAAPAMLDAAWQRFIARRHAGRRRAARLRRDRAARAVRRGGVFRKRQPAGRRAARLRGAGRAPRVRHRRNRRAVPAVDRRARRRRPGGLHPPLAALPGNPQQLVAAPVFPARDRRARTRRADGPALR